MKLALVCYAFGIGLIGSIYLSGQRTANEFTFSSGRLVDRFPEGVLTPLAISPRDHRP
jgi:hypothetical protein